MKCREYEAYSVLCQDCDIKEHIACSKKFHFDKKEKYISVQRKDFMNATWNEFPQVGHSIGYQPLNNSYRCPKCSQLISWETEEEEN